MTINTAIYQQKLATEKQEIESELTKIGYRLNGDRWAPQPIADETDIEFRDEVADEMEDMEEREATESALLGRLKNVNLALKKIADGTYGKCEISGEEIEPERLEANPAARTCKKHLAEEDQLT